MRGSCFLLQSERFFVEAIVVFDLVQSLFLERSFDTMQNVVYVMLVRPEGTFSCRLALRICSFVEAEALTSMV